MLQNFIFKKIHKKTNDKIRKHTDLVSSFLIKYIEMIDENNPIKHILMYIILNPNIILTLISIFAFFFSEQLLKVFNMYIMLNSLIFALTSFANNDKKIMQKLSIHVICLCITQLSFIGALPTISICYLLLSIDTKSILFEMITSGVGIFANMCVSFCKNKMKNLLLINNNNLNIKQKKKKDKHK